MRPLRHTHTLRKVRGTKGETLTFMCNDPKCSWKSPVRLIEGKEFKCPYCVKTFIYTPSMKSMRFPHCLDCTTGKKSKEQEPIEVKNQDDVLHDLLGEIEE